MKASYQHFLNPYDAYYPSMDGETYQRYRGYHDLVNDGVLKSGISTSGWIRGSIEVTGKVYLEFQLAKSTAQIGICEKDFNIGEISHVKDAVGSANKFLTIHDGGIEYDNTGVKPLTGLPTSGNNDLSLAIDTTTGEVWIGYGTPVTWIDNPETDPPTVTLVSNLIWTTYFSPSGDICFMPNVTEGGNCDYKNQPPVGFTKLYPTTNGGLDIISSNTEQVRASKNGMLGSKSSSSSYLYWTRTTPITTGKVYLELSQADNNCYYGICSDSYTFAGGGNNVGDITIGSHLTVNKLDHITIYNQSIYNSDVSIRYSLANDFGITLGAGTITLLAIDTTTGEVWLGKNGVWINNPETDPPSFTVDTDVKWCLFVRQHRAFVGLIYPSLRVDYKYAIPEGFKVITSELGVTGTVVDDTGTAVPDATIRSFIREKGVKFFTTKSNVLGEYEVGIPDGSESYLVCDSTPDGLLIESVDSVNLTPIDFDYGATGGGTPTDPTFKAMIRGNVKKLGLPYGAEIVGVSNVTPPAVVGSTTSDSVTGDYELDVAPYQGQVNVMAIPNYGVEFTASTVLPLDVFIRPTVPNGYLYRVTEAGTTGGTEPTWPTTENQVVTSGGVTMVTEYMLRPLVNSLLLPVIEPI